MLNFSVSRFLTKLFFLTFFISLLTFATYFVYTNFNNKKENTESSEVLAVVSPKTPQRIQKYFHENNIREECSSEQPFFNTSCESVVNKGQIVNMPEKVWYANPVLEEMLGEPIIFNYGGVYQINRNTVNDSSVTLISRLYSSINNRYTGACNTGKYPSTILKSGNLILWGSGGSQGNEVFRCMNNNPEYTLEDCNNYAKMFGIPLIKKFTSGNLAGKECIQRRGFYCYDQQFDCRMLNGDSEYWNGAKVYRTKFSKNSSGKLEMTLDKAYRTPGHPGYAVRQDAYKICQGKKRDGSCDNIAAVVLELPYPETNKDAIFMRAVDDPDERGNIKKAEGFNFWRAGNYLKNNFKSFYLRSFYGEEEKYQFFGPYFSGTETPYDSYKVGVDFLTYAYAVSGSPYTDYRIDKYELNKYGQAIVYKGYEFQKIQTFKPNFFNEYKLSDYSSERYWFTVWYDRKFLYVTRYRPTGKGVEEYTQMNSLSMPANFDYIKFYSTMPNVTFGITSNDDLDILISPQYTQMLKNSTIASRVFRAEKFNAPINLPIGKLTELTNLTLNPEGYKFDNPGPGNNNPISMRYYKTDDIDPTNDYAVFASKNYVFTSLIPSSVTCSLNAQFSLINTHPASVNFGIVPKNIGNNSTFDLNFSFENQPTFNCEGRITPLSSSAVLKLNLYDGINSNILLGSHTTSLQSNLKSFAFTNLSNKNYSKFFYTISVSFNGNEYLINSDSRYFTLENFVTINAFNDDSSSSPFYAAKLVVTKKKSSNEFQYNLDQLASNTSRFSINSNQFNNFYFDHNMKTSSGGLIDEYVYKICFTNSLETKINKVGFNPSNTSSSQISNQNLIVTIQNNCLELNYRNPSTTSYELIPQEVFVYLQKSSSVGPIDPGFKNFRVNGHIMMKFNPEVKIQINSESDKKYQGIYVSSVDKSEKSQRLQQASLDSNFKIPYYSSLTNAFNFQITSDYSTFNPPVSNTEFLYHLLTDNKEDLDPKNFDEINVYNLNNKKPSVIYVAKNKRIIFDLTNSNTLKSISNLFVVSTDKKNSQERIIFKIDCNNSNYSSICLNDRVVNIKGGIYGNFKLIGNTNTKIQDKDFIVINQNPEILILIQKDLRDRKIFNVTRSKTIFKYLE